jgi:hypothetical protein
MIRRHPKDLDGIRAVLAVALSGSRCERARAFCERWFGAVPGPAYHSCTRDFTQYFLQLGPSGSS